MRKFFYIFLCVLLGCSFVFCKDSQKTSSMDTTTTSKEGQESLRIYQDYIKKNLPTILSKENFIKATRISGSDHQEVDYVNTAWGQIFTDDKINAGAAGLSNKDVGESFSLDIMRSHVVITSSTVLTFDILKCEGGFDMEIMGGMKTTQGAERAFGITIIGLDAAKKPITLIQKIIYEYRTGQSLLRITFNGSQSAQQFIDVNPHFDPRAGFLENNIRPWELVKNSGIDPRTISSWSIIFSCGVSGGTTTSYPSVKPVCLEVSIKGLVYIPNVKK